MPYYAMPLRLECTGFARLVDSRCRQVGQPLRFGDRRNWDGAVENDFWIVNLSASVMLAAPIVVVGLLKRLSAFLLRLV